MPCSSSPKVARWAMAVILSALYGLGSVSFPTCFAEDPWTGWLGPERNGWVSSELPSTWPKDLAKQWSQEVGTGYGSPLVVEGRIFQHARVGDEEVLWCLTQDTGEVIWRKSVSVPFKPAGGGEYHGAGPKSCPVYAEGKVFTFSIRGELSAWDAKDGEQLWSRNYDQEFGKSHPNWGASASPVVDRDKVIVHFGTDEKGTLAALDVNSGEEVWRNGKDGASYSSPLIVTLEGVRQVVQWNHRAVVGVDVESGQSLWEFPFEHIGSDQNMPTPTFFNGRIVVGGENRGLHSVRPTRVDGRWVVKDEWHQTDVALDMSSAVINDGLLYGFSHYDSGRIFCLDPTRGKVLWTGPPRTGQNVTFLAAPGVIAALINQGELRILKADADEYQAVATYRVSREATWAPPVLLPGSILVKDAKTLTMWSVD